MKSSAIIGVIIVIILIVLAIIYARDTSGPAITVSPSAGPVSSRLDFTVDARDHAGVKSLSVTALQGEQKVPIFSKEYPAGTRDARETFKLPQQAQFKEGPLKLQVTSSDRAIYHFGAGNNSAKTVQFDYQNKPPAVTVLSTAHNIAHGGVGLAIYTANRELAKSGIVFANRFFPGYRQWDDVYACLFAWPYNLPAEQFIPKVLAVDRAGNERLTGIYFHLLPKTFRHDKIEVTDAFLDKVSAEMKDKFPNAKSPLEVFLKANSELRAHDQKILDECGRKTSPVPLWDGVFLRLPNSAPRGIFAQFRSYFYHGKLVDQQTHLGIDLASLPHSPIPAANRGKVVYADDLGIYGQCVIIDHGLGLQTLYGHLSRIGVKVGQDVNKGDVIGTTGDTGLAGGDHLHFGVVVSGEQVNPIEWWDPSWIQNNITSKFQAAKEAVPPAKK